ncbi:hypothetical protein GCM10022207_88880 [Streptomyces lannensis]|uniref:Uncharacterized protein n=1 Tax=Streptomyces lannensis TaxID=766498 RepID=A0ABP7LUS3_9ACTN
MVDAALDGAGVPVGAQALDNGVPVLLQAGGEGVQPGQVRGSGGGDPVLEVLAGAALKDLRETADVRVKGLQLRAVGEDSGELLVFLVAQALGESHHPAGDPADSRWCGWDDTDASPAPRSQVVTDDLVAPAISEGSEFGVQLDGVGVSFGPAFVQMGLVGVELAGPGLVPTGQQLFGDCRTGMAANGVAADVQFSGDLADAVALRQQGVDVACRSRIRASIGDIACVASALSPSFVGPSGLGTAVLRHVLWSRMLASTAVPRFCQRWNPSATWTAFGAPMRAPSA